MKENGQLLGQGKVDFQRVRDTLKDIGYRDWLVIEGAVPAGGQMFPAYVANRRFLAELMNA